MEKQNQNRKKKELERRLLLHIPDLLRERGLLEGEEACRMKERILRGGTS